VTFVIRGVVAPVLLLCVGFFTADFLLSGVYTWSRTSRVLVVTLAAIILSYEFVLNDQSVRQGSPGRDSRLKTLLLSCCIPYGVGFLLLMVIARLGLSH